MISPPFTRSLSECWSTWAPLILAAMAGYTSERSGVVNIALEGKALAAACAAALVSIAYGSAAGLAAAVAAATAFSLVHWIMTQRYAVDHVVSGMAINALAAGGTSFIFRRFDEPGRQGSVPAFPLSLYIVIALAVPLGLWLHARLTRSGLRLLAVGSDPDKARLAGVRPSRVRLGGLLATGLFAGLAGAALVADTHVFTDGMTAGRGFIALAALILGGWRPVPALFACIGFGFFSALQLQLQGTRLLGADIPSQAWTALPYVATLVALAGFLGRGRAPAGLGKP